MPNSDLFNKTPKKDPAQDDPFGTPEMQKRRKDAALEFLGVLQEHFLSSDGTGHAGTILSVAAWMAGSSLYRSMDYKNNPPPGTVVLSDGINDAWPELMNLFLFYCQRNGTDLKPDQLVINTPEEHRPQMEILQAQEKFQDRYYEIMKKHDLDYLDGARAGIIACSIVFQYHCARMKDVDPHIAAGIVSMGIVSGAKTAPMPLKPENAKPAASPASGQQDNQMLDLIISIAQNSIDGSGTRLVLGEGMASMQEALHNGGKYILVNPGVISKLEENNIDPFLIYAAAIRMEVASGISRIDFVGPNVDKLLEDWGEKPERQVPIHVRQLLWLKNNANKYSYERNGNSWRLKL